MWDKFIFLSETLRWQFEHSATPFDNGVQYDDCHTNLFFQSDKLELGHISIIDKREERGMWMMHVAAFTRPEYPMPIFGFDVICGKKKVSGCFHDISPTSVKHSSTSAVFADLTESLQFSKGRELPDWAKAIFSPCMIAVGQPTVIEIELLAECAQYMLTAWFNELDDLEPTTEYLTAHETGKAKYCENQLKNDNSRNVMTALGLEEDYVKKFKRIQFPY